MLNFLLTVAGAFTFGYFAGYFASYSVPIVRSMYSFMQSSLPLPTFCSVCFLDLYWQLLSSWPISTSSSELHTMHQSLEKKINKCIITMMMLCRPILLIAHAQNRRSRSEHMVICKRCHPKRNQPVRVSPLSFCCHRVIIMLCCVCFVKQRR